MIISVTVVEVFSDLLTVGSEPLFFSGKYSRPSLVQVLKVCANHYISPEMKLCALNNSDSAWCYTAPDFSEEECRTEKFAIKFKNSEQALLFKDAFEACQYEMSKKAVSISSPGATVAASGEVCLGQRTSVAAACAAITLLPEQADVDKRVDSLRISEAGSHHDTQSSSAFDRFDVSSVKKTVDEVSLGLLIYVCLMFT